MGNDSDTEGQTRSQDDMRISKTSTEPIIMAGPDTTAMVANVPYIASMNVKKSVGVHIGTKVVSITQNVQNTEGVRGRFLGLELLSATSSKRLRCSVAIFVCWALVVVSTLVIAFFIYYFSPTRLDIGLKASWYLRRADWQALPHYRISYRSLPVKNVIIGHTVTPYCNDRYSCIKAVMDIQSGHLKRRNDDIGPNYLVGGEGFIFEGRGSNVIGMMIAHWNVNSISIMFIGDYRTDYPDPKQFDHLNEFFDVLVAENVLEPDYVVYGHCQISTYIVTPGPNIRDNLRNFTHWNEINVDKCLDGEKPLT